MSTLPLVLGAGVPMTSTSSWDVAAGGKERMIGVKAYQILMRAAVKTNSAKTTGSSSKAIFNFTSITLITS